jgi:hypothetical protein
MNQFSPEITHSAKTAISDDRNGLNGRLRLDSHWEGQTFSEFIPRLLAPAVEVRTAISERRNLD